MEKRIEKTNERERMSSMKVVYDGVLDPMEFVELLTGEYYFMRADDQLQEMRDILNKNHIKVKDYSIVSPDIPSDAKVVLVLSVNITSNGQQRNVLRWFEIPFTEDVLRQRVSAL